MILGTGIDLLKVSRIKKLLDNYGDIFVKKVFSEYEIKKNKNITLKVSKIAKLFATKEAFVKALGTGFTKEISFKDISLINEERGKPIIDLSNRVQEYLKKKTPNGYKTIINVSISDEKEYVISNVILSFQKELFFMQLSIFLLLLLVLYIVFTSESKWEALKIIISAGAIALFIRTFFFQPFTIPSGSMIPTLLVGDFIFVSQYKYGYSKHSLPFSLPLFKGRVLKKKPKRGDVVVFKTPNDNRTDYVKTLIGLPGDKIKVKDGRLYINNTMLNRDSVLNSSIKIHNNYLTEFDYIEIFPNGKKHIIRELKGDNSSSDNTIIYTVPENNFFLMGDNRDNSIDSRVLNYVGVVPFENLVGKAEIIFFSIDKKGYGLKNFWKWKIRFDRIGKILNKKVNMYYES